jgi:D-beta-D-heptose 7-phosphate kinase/D-beta-D-heptose 1-phosphate adenosyltransferase
VRRPRLDPRRLDRLIDGFADVRLLVVGDVFLDEYLWGEVDRVSPEAPVPVVHVREEARALGGAGNVVRNVVALGGRCSFCSVVGPDAAGRRVLDLLKELGVDPVGVAVEEGRPTTRKTRVVASSRRAAPRGGGQLPPSQQIVRLDRETVEPLPARTGRELLRSIGAAAAHADGVVLEDYGKGLFSSRFLREAMRRFRAAGVPVAVDPKHELAPFRGAQLVKPNLQEAEALAGITVLGPEDLERVVRQLRRKIGDADVVVTRGGDGMTVFEAGRPGVPVPTAVREVFDVQGAGDTVIAALVLARRAGATLLESAVLANAAAGVVVGKIGTATATPDELRDRLPAAIAAAQDRA